MSLDTIFVNNLRRLKLDDLLSKLKPLLDNPMIAAAVLGQAKVDAIVRDAEIWRSWRERAHLACCTESAQFKENNGLTLCDASKAICAYMFARSQQCIQNPACHLKFVCDNPDCNVAVCSGCVPSQLSVSHSVRCVKFALS